jgi:hypothetical protein
MPKALIAGIHGQTLSSAEEWVLGARFNGTTEAHSQYSATEGASFTGLRGVIASGGSGTNTFRFRDGGADGQNVVARVGAGSGEDTTNTDTLTAGDLFNGSYIDTGTNSVVRTWAINVEMASGHGNFHASSRPAAGTLADGYQPIHGDNASSASTPDTAQFEVREYTSIEAFQVRLTINPNVGNTVYSLNVNGVDVGTAITFAAGVTGLQTVTGMGISLSPGDLVCISVNNNGGFAPTASFLGVTAKSTGNASAAGYAILDGFTVDDADPTIYLSFGQGRTTSEAGAAVKVGFAARCKYLRGYVSANTQDADSTLKLFVNGSAVLTATIAAGVTGGFRNLIDSADIAETDVVSLEVQVGGIGSITVHQAWISFHPIEDDPEPEPEPAADRSALGGEYLPPRRIKRETVEKRGRTLREMFEPSPRAPTVAPPLPEPAPTAENNPLTVPIGTIANDTTPLLDALTSLREVRAERALAQAIEDDDFEVLMVI